MSSSDSSTPAEEAQLINKQMNPCEENRRPNLHSSDLLTGMKQTNVDVFCHLCLLFRHSRSGISSKPSSSSAISVCLSPLPPPSSISVYLPPPCPLPLHQRCMEISIMDNNNFSCPKAPWCCSSPTAAEQTSNPKCVIEHQAHVGWQTTVMSSKDDLNNCVSDGICLSGWRGEGQYGPATGDEDTGGITYETFLGRNQPRNPTWRTEQSGYTHTSES